MDDSFHVSSSPSTVEEEKGEECVVCSVVEVEEEKGEECVVYSVTDGFADCRVREG